MKLVMIRIKLDVFYIVISLNHIISIDLYENELFIQ
jgi:hypothetical protein